jgi:hypothetical protein
MKTVLKERKAEKSIPKKELKFNGRALRKTRIGVVVSSKMDKTVSVAIERKVPHPIYKKYYQKDHQINGS